MRQVVESQRCTPVAAMWLRMLGESDQQPWRRLCCRKGRQTAVSCALQLWYVVCGVRCDFTLVVCFLGKVGKNWATCQRGEMMIVRERGEDQR